MPIKVHIPTPLRPFLGNKDELELDANGSTTVGNLLSDLAKNNEGLKKHLFSEDGKIRNFVNIYLNEEDIRYQEGDKTPLKEGDVLSIVPSIAGGIYEYSFS